MSEQERYIPGVPCWIDTAQPDPEAATAFYGGLFGWEYDDQPIDDEQQLALARRWGELQVYAPLRFAGIDVPLEWVEDNEESPPKSFLTKSSAPETTPVS